MAVVAIVAPRDMRERAKLIRRQRAIRNRDPQHVGVKLQIDAVHQPQRLEFVFGQFARQPARHLIAKFVHPFGHQRAVEIVVDVHGARLVSDSKHGRQVEGRTSNTDTLAQIARLDASFIDLHGRDIGADRVDVVGGR